MSGTLSPTAAINTAVLITLSVTLYTAAITANITAPHPKRLRICIYMCLGTRSYAWLKSMNVTNNFSFFKSVSIRNVTICSRLPRLFCAPVCSRYEVSHFSNLEHTTISNNLATLFITLMPLWFLVSFRSPFWNIVENLALVQDVGHGGKYRTEQTCDNH